MDVPIPPQELIRRAGSPPGADVDVTARYLSHGRANKELLAALLEGAPGRPRVLDFGCGAGEVLRHFAEDRERLELFGCDVDGASIDWLAEHHGDYASFFRVEETPGIPFADGSFDLIYAISVFTHVAEQWAGWLVELHRVLAPHGLLAVTVLGEGMIEVERGGLWREDEIGMNVLRRGQDWAGGGPTVFHSHWWIREHWGRIFEIVEIREDRNDDGSAVAGAHDMVTMRRREVALSAAGLERINLSDPRELLALRRNIAQLHDDDAHLRELLAQAQARGDSEHEQRVALAAALEAAELELERVRGALEVITRSRSWRATAPLRALRRRP